MRTLTSDSFRWFRDSDGGWLCVKCSRPDQILDGIVTGKQYDVTIKQHREHRSLDANAYMWVLLDRLSEAVEVPKEELYQNLIKNIGGVSETVCVKSEAVEQLCSGWQHNGLGWPTETLPSKIPGCTNVILYYGSSTYDTAQMHRLIDLVIQECKQHGIETLSPDKIKELEAYDG